MKFMVSIIVTMGIGWLISLLAKLNNLGDPKGFGQETSWWILIAAIIALIINFIRTFDDGDEDSKGDGEFFSLKPILFRSRKIICCNGFAATGLSVTALFLSTGPFHFALAALMSVWAIINAYYFFGEVFPKK